MRRELLASLPALRVIAVASILAAPAHASTFSSSARGTTAAEFLELGVGARAVGMGEAYTAVADEASALFWNPAAMVAIPNRSATFMHAPYINSSSFDYLSYAQNLGNWGAFGVGLQYFSAGGINQTDASGTDIGAFTPYDLALSLGYAHRLNGVGLQAFDGFSLGLGAKFIHSKLATSAQAAAVDLGVLSPGYLDDRLKLASTVTNLGGTMKFDAVQENLPLAIKFGSSFKMTKNWLTAMDLGFPSNDDPYLALGTEQQLCCVGEWKFAGRAGFNSRTMSGIDGFAGISIGMGVGYGTIRIDYAFVPFGGVGQAHGISLTASF